MVHIYPSLLDHSFFEGHFGSFPFGEHAKMLSYICSCININFTFSTIKALSAITVSYDKCMSNNVLERLYHFTLPSRMHEKSRFCASPPLRVLSVLLILIVLVGV